MSESKPTLAERYNHQPGGFHACVDALAIPGEPEASVIIRRVCRERTVWPEQLFGYERAARYHAATQRSVPLSTGRCDEPSRIGYVVTARRLVWIGLHYGTHLSIADIAMLFGYSPETVHRWASSWRHWPKAEGTEWWRFWGRALADMAGVPFDADYGGRS